MQFIVAPTTVLLSAWLLHFSIADARIATSSPVEKVVNLLTDLKTKLQDDQERDQQTYDKYACWCEQTTARKASAIDKARTDLRSLGQEILIQRGLVASKTAEIEQAAKDIKENEQAQQALTSIRQKENEAYMIESAEMKKATTALENAVIVLRDATGFLQLGGGAGARLNHALASVQDVLANSPTRTLQKWIQPSSGGSSNLLVLSKFSEQVASGARTHYTPQSSTIQGILKDMYDTFASDLESLDTAEAGKNRAFEDLIATKQEELLLLQKRVEDAQKAKAEAELMLAEATQTYDDTEAQFKADVDFFDATKLACTGKSMDWKERKELREDELAGVQEALRILGSDEARELFGKAINTPGVQQAFLQLSSFQSSVEDLAAAPARKAYRIVKGLATQGKSIQLARLAAHVHSAKVGHFETVIQSIDSMIEEVRADGQADIAKRDQCKEEYLKIESKTKDLEWKIKNNDATIDKLTLVIEKMEQEKTQTLEQIQEINGIIDSMNTTRQEENAAFQVAKQDDEDAIVLLEEAKTVLERFYSNNSIELGPIQGGEAGFLQAGPEFDRSPDDAPEATFSGKGHRKHQAKGIVALLSHIIEDLHGEITVGMKAEDAAQVEYEKQLQAAQALLFKLGEKKINLETSIADRGVKKEQEKQDKIENQGDLTSEQDYKKDIDPDCTFILEKFSERAAQRTTEIEGLTQAKAYLAGYQDSAKAVADLAMLQGRPSAQLKRKMFDDDEFGRIQWHSFH